MDQIDDSCIHQALSKVLNATGSFESINDVDFTTIKGVESFIIESKTNVNYKKVTLMTCKLKIIIRNQLINANIIDDDQVPSYKIVDVLF